MENTRPPWGSATYDPRLMNTLTKPLAGLCLSLILLGCETPYHPECLAEFGGCSTLGCTVAGKLPESISQWFCRACHQPIDNSLTRRTCPCRATLHDPCVEDHMRVCKEASQLRRNDGLKPTGPRGSFRAYDAEQEDAAGRVMLMLTVIGCVAFAGILLWAWISNLMM